MRIVAGRHRGRHIEAPPGNAVRPTADRTRQAVFNILEHGSLARSGSLLIGRTVLDGFAGTGAYGLEALSRGAAHAVFCDIAPSSLGAVRANLAALGEAERATIVRVDATRPIGVPRCTASLVFLDPPYGQGLATKAATSLDRAGWLDHDCTLVIEVGTREICEPPGGFALAEERHYGAARLLFMRRL